jgi:hypothetical protein
MVSGFSMSLRGTIVFRSWALAIKQFSAPYPSLCHMGPDSLVLWIVCELGHEFAFSGEPIEFFRGIHRLASPRRLWTFALNRRAIMFWEGLVVAVTPRQMDTATATRVWQRNAPRGIWFRPIGKFSRWRVVIAPINRLIGANVLQCGDVRFGSKADIEVRPFDVRFTPKSGHQLSALGCPLCAK